MAVIDVVSSDTVAMNGSGVRDTGHALSISPTTVSHYSFKKLNPPQLTLPLFDQATDINGLLGFL